MLYCTVSYIYLQYNLFLNESVCNTVNNFLLFAMINILIVSRAKWKIAALTDKRAFAVSITEQILQHIMDNITG